MLAEAREGSWRIGGLSNLVSKGSIKFSMRVPITASIRVL